MFYRRQTTDGRTTTYSEREHGSLTIKLLPPELHFFTPICIKLFVGWGFAPNPNGELTVLPRPLAVFSGPTSKRRDGEERGREKRGKDGRRGEGREGDKREGRG